MSDLKARMRDAVAFGYIPAETRLVLDEAYGAITTLEAKLAVAREALGEIVALFDDGIAGVDHRGFQQEGEAKRYVRVTHGLRKALKEIEH